MKGILSTIETNQSLELAYRDCSSAWFPFDPTILQTIRSRIDAGHYAIHENALTEDLSSDFALYFYCIKRLRTMLTAKKTSSKEETTESLPEILANTSLEDLKKILQAPERNISYHSLSETTDFQTARLRDSLLSATTAEALAPCFDLDSELSFSCALLRQLGLTLISWNYPTVYRQALTHLSQIEHSTSYNLDTQLHAMLGFSPAMLGIKFGKSWGLSREIMATLVASAKPNPSLETPKLTKNGSVLLAQICSVGESFARANNPEHYPSARTDWDAAERIISRYLGKDGLDKIYQRTNSLSRHYAQCIPDISCPHSLIEPQELKQHSEYSLRLLKRNVYLRACPTVTARKISQIYTKMTPDAVSNELIRVLTHEIVPELGFESLAIFMLDPSSSTLIPLLKVGSPSFIKLKPISLLAPDGCFDAIRTAFSRTQPLCEEGHLKDGSQKTFITGIIGEKKAIGVLYLESATDDMKSHAATLYRALVCCLNDLLQLG